MEDNVKGQVLQRYDGGGCFASADSTFGGATKDDGDTIADGAQGVIIVRDAESARRKGLMFFDRRGNFSRRQSSTADNVHGRAGTASDVAEVPPHPITVAWPWVCVPLCATCTATCRMQCSFVCWRQFDVTPGQQHRNGHCGDDVSDWSMPHI